MAAANGKVQTLVTPDRLDAAAVDSFKREFRQALDGSCGGLVVDLSRTLFIDSAGLGSLVSLLKGCNQEGKRLALGAPTPQVRQIIELTRLHRLFDIYDSIEAAKNAVQK